MRFGGGANLGDAERLAGRQSRTIGLSAAPHALRPLGCVAPTGLGVLRFVYTALTCGAIDISPLRGLCYPLSAVGVLTNRRYISLDKPGKKIMTQQEIPNEVWRGRQPRRCFAVDVCSVVSPLRGLYMFCFVYAINMPPLWGCVCGEQPLSAVGVLTSVRGWCPYLCPRLVSSPTACIYLGINPKKYNDPTGNTE